MRQGRIERYNAHHCFLKSFKCNASKTTFAGLVERLRSLKEETTQTT